MDVACFVRSYLRERYGRVVGDRERLDALEDEVGIVDLVFGLEVALGSRVTDLEISGLVTVGDLVSMYCTNLGGSLASSLSGRAG